MNNLQHHDILILVVDDDQLLRQVIAEIFLDEGFSVLQAGNAGEALGLIESCPNVHLVFTDVQMPGRFDGFGLIDYVHAHWPQILLMVASGQVSPKLNDLPDDARFIQKPFNHDKLLQEVNTLFADHLAGFES